MANIADDASGTVKLAEYSYLGAGTPYKVAHPQVTGGLNLDYGPDGVYNGWDRFGRLVDQRWAKDNATDVARWQHGYDRNSNKKYGVLWPRRL